MRITIALIAVCAVSCALAQTPSFPILATGGGSGAPPIAVPFTGVTTKTSLVTDPGRSASDVPGTCRDNGTPSLTIALTAGYPQKAANGDITWTWTGTKTGVCDVIPGGASGAAGGDLAGVYPNPSLDVSKNFSFGGLVNIGAGKLIPPGCTIPLPPAGLNNNLVCVATNAASSIDCTVGGGTGNTPALCKSTGIVWVSLGGGGGGSWGSIAGTLSSQTDLQSALNAKAPVSGPTFTGTVSGTFSGNLTGNVNGNASTATALSADPSPCGTGQYVSDIAANGAVTCGTPAGGKTNTPGASGVITVDNSGPTQSVIDADQAVAPTLQGANEWLGLQKHATTSTQSITGAGVQITPTLNVVNVSPTSNVTLTVTPNIQAPTGTRAQRIELCNVHATNSLTLRDKANLASSGISNGGQDLTLAGVRCAGLIWSPSLGLWSVVGSSGGGGVADPGANGLMVRTGLNTTATRTNACGPGLVCTNPDGVSGNPQFDLDPLDTSVFWMVEEFISSTNNAATNNFGSYFWRNSVVTGGGVTEQNANTLSFVDQSVIAMTSTQANGRATLICCGSGSVTPFNALNSNTGWDARFTVFTDVNQSTEHQIRIGFMSTPADTPTNFIGVRLLNSAGCTANATDSFWSYETISGGTGTVTPSAQAFATSQTITFRMRSIVAGTVLFSYRLASGSWSSETAISTNVPSSGLAPGFQMIGCNSTSKTLRAMRFALRITGLPR